METKRKFSSSRLLGFFKTCMSHKSDGIVLAASCLPVGDKAALVVDLGLLQEMLLDNIESDYPGLKESIN